MDATLISWARAVKARQRRQDKRTRRKAGRDKWGGASRPVLWLLTDAARLSDPLAAIRNLPGGRLAGVVYRPEGAAEPHQLGRRIAELCRARGLALAVAGDARLAVALHAGLHLRGGRTARRLSAVDPLTSSAHSRVELRRAARAGADFIFLSPAFRTGSHPGRAALGAVRWAALARTTGTSVLALGGIDGRTARRLPRRLCAGAGAIEALRPGL